MRRILFLALLTLTCLFPRVAGAQVELPITPDPAECDADPIDIAALLERVATPITRPPATPAPTPRTSTAEEFAEMTEAVIASVACTNANQPLRALSYFTDDYLLNRLGEEPAVTLGHLEAASTRTPGFAAMEDRVTIESWSAGPAGEKVAYLQVETVSGGEPTLASLRMMSTHTGWKIDDVVIAIID